MNTSSKQAAVFDSYAAAVPLITDADMLDELANQCLDDRRLTENQRDALMALLEARGTILHVRRLHRGAT